MSTEQHKPYKVMTQEEKQLLLVDLCARLPYGVKVQHQHENYLEEVQTVEHISRKYGEIETESVLGFVDDFKPYLRPMSSMTEEECIELDNIEATIENISKVIPNIPYHIEVVSSKQIDWLNAHHFDYRGLIPKGLAIEVTEENNPYNK